MKIRILTSITITLIIAVLSASQTLGIFARHSHDLRCVVSTEHGPSEAGDNSHCSGESILDHILHGSLENSDSKNDAPLSGGAYAAIIPEQTHVPAAAAMDTRDYCGRIPVTAIPGRYSLRSPPTPPL